LIDNDATCSIATNAVPFPDAIIRYPLLVIFVVMPQPFLQPFRYAILPSIVWIAVLCPVSCQDLNTWTESSTPLISAYEAPEPFPYLKDYCADCLPEVDASPDPLVRYSWDDSVNASQLQIYRIHQPTSYKVLPRNAISENDLQVFFREKSVEPPATVSTSLKIYQNCTIVLDWGVERAAWFELQMKAPPSTATILASLSEFNEPYPGKTKELTRYGELTYRLETNDELYEGIRFTFLHISFIGDDDNKSDVTSNKHHDESLSPSVEILDVSLVAKIKPIAYTGSFQSSNDELTQAWYTGAYGVRLNMEANGFNSVLVERGDRVAIQGDGHPTMDTALVAFASPAILDMVKTVLQETDSSHQNVVDDSIMAYPLYWCISAMDYYWASGDQDFFVEGLTPDIQILLDKRIDDYLHPDLDITWFGWDDRVGNGWCYHENDKCNREAHLAFAALAIRVCNDFTRALRASNQDELARYYYEQSAKLSQQLRQVPEYPFEFGVHAAANVLNAVGTATANETDYWMATTLNNPITICSFSQFNQYWILQAFGNVGNVDAMERALESIKMCWGPMVKLGKGCFWEMSSPEWVRFLKDGDQAPHLPSYCHPWASGVTPWLSHVLGGLVPVTPGYKLFAALPYVSATHTFVSTNMPTAHGTIAVIATLREDLSLELSVSSIVLGIVGLRSSVLGFDGSLHSISQDSILVNGQPANTISQQQAKHLLRGKVGDEGAFVFVRVSGGGTSLVTASYGNVQSFSELTKQESRHLSTNAAFPVPKYPATTSMDRESQGNGLNIYGKDGFALFSCDGSGGDVLQLPSYVTNLTVIRHGFPGYVEVQREFVGYSDTNPVYLPLSGRRGRSRAQRGLGRINLNDMGAGDINCVLVDVQISDPRPYTLSVYSVAESEHNKHAIRVMDGYTLNLIAPTPLIDDYVDGVWWTVHYNSSIRLKFLDMKGIYLSAVAFSSSND
jgi:alpha-L-rhamnosidase